MAGLCKRFVSFISFLAIFNLPALFSFQSPQTDFFHFPWFTISDFQTQGIAELYGFQPFYRAADGYMWVAASNGLYLSDGTSFSNKLPVPGLAAFIGNNMVNAVYGDQRGRIWIGTNSIGLVMVPLEKDTFYVFSHAGTSGAIPGNRINIIHEGLDSSIWIGFNDAKGFAVFQEDTRTFKSFLLHKEKPLNDDKAFFSNIIKGIVNDPDNADVLWLATMRGLWRFDTQSGEALPFFLQSDGLINGPDERNAIRDIAPDNSIIWLATWGGGLWKFDIEQSALTNFFNPDKSLSYNDFRSLIVLDDARILLSGAQSAQLTIFNKSTGHFIYSREVPWSNVPNFAFGKLYRDYEGNIFAGTIAHGMVLWKTRFNESLDIQIFHHDAGSFRQVKYLSEANRIIALRNENFAISEIDPENFAGVDYSFSLLNDLDHSFSVRGLARYNQGHYLLLDNLGLWELADGRAYNRSSQWIPDFDFPHVRLISDHLDNNGSWWIGTNWGGMHELRFNVPNANFEALVDHTASIVHPNWILKITSDQGGRVWYGTEAGFGFFQPGEGLYSNFPYNPDYARRAGTDLKQIVRINETADEIWVVSHERLMAMLRINQTDIVLNDSDVFEIPERCELLLKVLKSADGTHYWLLCNQQILAWHPERGVLQVTSQQHGLIHANDFYLLDDSTFLLLGSSSFQKLSIPAADLYSTPMLQLERYAVFNESHPVDKLPLTLKLNHEQHFITFHFKGVDFLNPQNLSYSYKLEGAFDQWISLGNENSAVFSNLSPGNYSFYVKVSVDGSFESEPVLLATIYMRPPFYSTIWFIGLTGLIAILLFRVAYSWRIRQIKSGAALKAAFDKRIAELQWESLKSQMNPHFLFNALNSIKALVIRGSTDEAAQYINRFSKLIRLILQNSRADTVPLQQELDTLRLYIEIEHLRFDGRFSYQINMDEAVPVSHIEVPPLILQPYIENAIWHGLMHKTTDDGHLQLDVSPATNGILVTITDNGIGRKAASAFKTSVFSEKRSMGLRITEDRVNLINEIYQANANVSIEDLYSQDGRATGTRVEVFIPHIKHVDSA